MYDGIMRKDGKRKIISNNFPAECFPCNSLYMKFALFGQTCCSERETETQRVSLKIYGTEVAISIIKKEYPLCGRTMTEKGKHFVNILN